jgi:hypothetical protein
MMTNDLKSLVPAQEKLEWVTPTISLMDTQDTLGKLLTQKVENLVLNRGPS